MKGYAEEMLYFVAIIFSVFMLFVFFMYQIGTRGAEVKKTVEERKLSEEIASTISSLFNSKLPFVEKTYIQIAIDSILEGHYRNKERYQVFYGIGTGRLNVTEIIPPFFENYVKRRWELKIETPESNYTYGHIEKKKIIYSYEALIPVPEERIGKIQLFIGEPQ